MLYWPGEGGAGPTGVLAGWLAARGGPAQPAGGWPPASGGPGPAAGRRTHQHFSHSKPP